MLSEVGADASLVKVSGAVVEADVSVSAVCYPRTSASLSMTKDCTYLWDSLNESDSASLDSLFSGGGFE